MKNLLRVTVLAICAIFMVANVSAQDNYNATTMGEIVRYYETAKWGQGSPFNNQCWTDATQQAHAKTGCVPTAFAIIMRHHGFPVEGIGNLPNQQTGEVFTDRTYDYSKMPLTNGSNWTTEQQNEVAKLMAHLGHAFGVTFGSGTTSVTIGNTMSERMRDFFNYKYTAVSNQYNNGTMYDFEEWKNNLKNSLDNGCPVPYAADNKKDGTNDTRHMFVVDGYTTEGYFHINFGWYGSSSNGWYKLDDITPTGDDYSWRTTSNGYDSKHQAFFNLMPNRTMRTVTASVSPTGAGTVTVNGSANSAEVMEGITATLVATANSGYTFSHWSKDGTEVGTDMTYRAKVAAEGNEYVANFYTIGSSVNIPVNYDSNMGSVTYNGNIVSATGFNPNEYSEVTLTAEANDGYMFTGWEIVEGTETTKSSEKSITFIAKSGIEVTAHFALAGGEYKINKDNITPSGGNNSYCPTWTYSKAGDIEEILTLSTANGSTPVNALSKTSNRLYAHAYDDSSNSFREITYTLTAKEGFVITGYSLTYVVGSSYKGEVTVRNATQSLTPNDTEEHTLTYQYANAARSSAYGTRTAEFVLSSTTAHNSQYITIKDLSVTVLSEGAEGGESTPTTYTINVTANPGTGGTATVNGNSSATVGEGSSVTLAATAASGYIFTGWYKGAEKVSGDANYTFTPAESASYEARFVAKAVSNCNIPTDNTLRYYRFAIAIAPNSYTTDFGSNYENVKKFWQECEDFMNEVYVPLGMCFDVVIDQRLLLDTNLPDNNGLPNVTGVTDLINNAIGSGSYDVGLCISYRDDSEENTGLSDVNGAYSSTRKANGYAQADKWVVAHEAGHLFGADHTTEGESSLMDNIGEFFSYPSIKKIRDASVNNGPSNAYKSEVVANNAPTFTAQMKNTYRIPKGACLSIPVYASDADGHSLRYAAIGCSSSTVGNITGGGTMPHFASLKPQTSNIIDYSPKFVADGEDYYLPVDGTNIPSMSAGSYSIAILVNDMPEGNSYDYLNSNPFYSNYDVWDATVEIVDGDPFTASISPAQNSYTAGSNVTVTWVVNNSVFTEDSRVRITMSTDYGKTFSHVLADDVRALDGSKAVTLPNVNVGNVDVDFSTQYVSAVRSMRAGIIRVEVIDGAAYTLTTLSPENGGGFNITDGGSTPTPTTYAITTAANPAEGGTAKFSVGTGSQQTQGNVNSGELITLYAVANDGYKFVNWTLNSTEVSTEANYSFKATGNTSLVANFEPEAAEPVLPITGTEVNATFAGATGFVNKGYTNQVVLQTAPAITFSANDAKIGYSTVDGTKHPYLFKGTDFTISVPAPYKIAGYKLTVQGHNFNEGTFTYTVGTQNAAAAMRTAASARSNTATATATISGTTPLSVMATDLNTSEINIGVGSASAETAGIIVKELQLDLVQESQEPVEVSGDLEFTFTRNGSDVDVTVSGAEGVTATIAATSPDATNTTTTTGSWNTGNAMASRTEILCTSTNTTNATENSPITYTLTVQGLKANITAAKFTNIAVNKDGGLQQVNNSTRECNFKLDANGETVKTLNNQNIWVTSGTENTIEFNDLSVAADGTLTIKLTIYRGTSNDGCYYGLKKITLTADPLAGKYFRLKEKSTGTYMNIYDNSTHGKETRGGVNVTTKNESNDGQIFQFIESGTNYKLLSKTGYYITLAEWNVNADSKENGADLTFEPTTEELEYFISCTKGYFKIDDDKGTPSLGKFVYSDGAKGDAATWVLEEVVYYTVTATAGKGGSVSPSTSTVEKGKPVTLTATANEGYHFVNWTKDDVEVSTKATDTFTATANGEYVANFAINTYAITATANPGTGGSASVSAATVEHGGETRLTATPNAGYYFVKWTKGTEDVSSENPYTINSVTSDAEYIANFEEIVVNATLTDTQSNTYNVELSGFTSGVTKETVAAKLKEAYPYITLGSTDQNGDVIDFGVLEANGTAYTYTNKVELPFKVSNAAYLWHNIYYPSNGGNPNYIAALNEDEVVDMAASKDYAYGDNPTYNTKDGGNSICWAIYNVNNSFEFIFKSRVTGKYIKVESVSSETIENVKFVENAEDATVFTLLVDTGTYNGDYALVANIEGTTGYLCATSSSESFVTHYNGKGHQGAWAKFVEAPDYFSMIQDLGIALGYFFGYGDRKCIITGTEIEPIDAALKDNEGGSITLNTLKEYAQTIEDAMATWPTIRLSVAPDESGTVTINGEEGVTSKRAPDGHEFPIAAVPAEGYHFVNWTKGTDVVSTNTEHAVTISGVKGEITDIIANFAINIYNINVTAGEGGNASASAATAEHGSEVTLTAVANAGYEFVNWTKGGEVVSNNTNYTFVATANGEYVANFRQIVNCIVTVTATTIGGENGGTVKVAVGTTESNESLVVNKDANVTFTATTAGTNYRFAGWYNENDECVSTDASYSTTITANTTYNAKFIKQVDVRIELIKNGYAFAYIGDEATLTHKVFDYGTTVDIHAISYSADAIFAYWTLDGTKLSQDADYSFVAEEDSYYFVANFNYKACIAVVAGDNGTAYIGSEGVTTFEMATGNTVTITAKANSGYVFDHWALMDGSSDEGTTVSTSAVYTLTLNANPNTTVTYKAFFRQITALEDGKAYRIAGKMSDGTLRYIYRDGQNLKWSTTKDETTKSIFIAQSDFKGSLNLISAVGDYGWDYDGDLSHSYATLKTDAGSKDGTFTLYAVSGNYKRSYNAYGTSTSNDLNFNTGTNIRKENTDGNCTDMVFEEVPFAFQVSVADGSNAKLGTVNLPFATTVPAGVTAYGVDYTEGEQVYMKELELTNNVLPANTPVLIEAEAAGKYGFKPAPASANVYDTGFAGTLEAEDIPGTTNAYILSYKGVGTHIMLYKLSSTDRKINANKAYYIDATGKASSLRFVFGGTTDIEEVKGENGEVEAIYDLQGRKLSEITEPGMYIINGKKVYKK